MVANASQVITAAGSALSISSAVPASRTVDGFQALAFTAVGEVTSVDSFGREHSNVDYTPLAQSETQTLKGSFTQGSLALEMGRDLTDAGQQLLIEANNDINNAANLYSFRVVLQNGDTIYFTARVMSYTTNIGEINSIISASANIVLQGDPVLLTNTGVLATSISTAGTGYASDGTFTATQAATSGSGSGATFSVTISGGAVTAVETLTTGFGYAAADTITLAIAGNAATTDAELTVSTVVASL